MFVYTRTSSYSKIISSSIRSIGEFCTPRTDIWSSILLCCCWCGLAWSWYIYWVPTWYYTAYCRYSTYFRADRFMICRRVGSTCVVRYTIITRIRVLLIIIVSSYQVAGWERYHLHIDAHTLCTYFTRYVKCFLGWICVIYIIMQILLCDPLSHWQDGGEENYTQ